MCRKQPQHDSESRINQAVTGIIIRTGFNLVISWKRNPKLSHHAVAADGRLHDNRLILLMFRRWKADTGWMRMHYRCAPLYVSALAAPVPKKYTFARLFIVGRCLVRLMAICEKSVEILSCLAYRHLCECDGSLLPSLSLSFSIR